MPEFTPEELKTAIVRAIRLGAAESKAVSLAPLNEDLIILPTSALVTMFEYVHAGIGIFVCLKGHACWFYNGRDPVSGFRLIAEGFPDPLAYILADALMLAMVELSGQAPANKPQILLEDSTPTEVESTKV